MMMMSLQPTQGSQFSSTLRVLPRKVKQEELDIAEPEATVTTAKTDNLDATEPLSAEEEAKARIKEKKAEAKKKKQLEDKKHTQDLLKKVGIGVGATVGTVVTGGLLAGYLWYKHEPKLPVTGDDMIKYAGSLATMSTVEKDNLVKQFQHLELDFKKGENGIKEAITGFRKSASMSKTHKDRTLSYLFKEGGISDFLFSRDVKFKKTMANITGEIFANKEGQRNVAIFSSISNNMTVARAIQEESGTAVKKGDLTPYKYTVLTNTAEGSLTAETRRLPIQTSVFEAATTEVEKLLADTKSITSKNSEGFQSTDYLPNLTKSITETLNPLLKQKGLAEIDISTINATNLLAEGHDAFKEIGSGTVAKVFLITATDGKTYAAKVVHPAVNKDVFPNILNRYILDLQLNEGLSHSDAVLKAMQKLGNLAQETDLAVEHKVHEHLYDNYKKGYTAVAIHQPVGLHNTSTEQVFFQEEIPGLHEINDEKHEHTLQEKAVANIKSLNQILCGVLIGNMQGDLHPGNLGFDADGNIRMLDFGKNIFISGETPKHIRGLMRGVLAEKADPELLSALKAINPETFDRLNDKQKTELLTKLKASPFSMAEMLFKYHFLNQPENINANYSAFADMAKLNTTVRTSAGIHPHTNYQEMFIDDIKPRKPEHYNNQTHLYGHTANWSSDSYQDEATEYMPTYLNCAETFLKTLCQDDPTLLQNDAFKQEMIRKYLDQIAVYSPGRELTVRYLPLLKEEGIDIDYASHIAAGVENIPMLGGLIKGQINKEIQRDMDNIKKPSEFDADYVRPITLPSKKMNQSA